MQLDGNGHSTKDTSPIPKRLVRHSKGTKIAKEALASLSQLRILFSIYQLQIAREIPPS